MKKISNKKKIKNLKDDMQSQGYSIIALDNRIQDLEIRLNYLEHKSSQSTVSPPEPPTDVRATSDGDTVTITFNRVWNAKSYIVTSKQVTFWHMTYATSPIVIKNVAPGDYDFYVSAINEGGVSVCSNQAYVGVRNPVATVAPEHKDFHMGEANHLIVDWGNVTVSPDMDRLKK